MVSCTLTLKAHSVTRGTSLSFWDQTSHGYKGPKRAVRLRAQKVRASWQPNSHRGWWGRDVTEEGVSIWHRKSKRVSLQWHLRSCLGCGQRTVPEKEAARAKSTWLVPGRRGRLGGWSKQTRRWTSKIRSQGLQITGHKVDPSRKGIWLV